MAASKPRLPIEASTSDGGDPIATTAVNAAKQFAGDHTRRRSARPGLQALDDKLFTGPLWEKLTGIKIKVIEAPFPQIYSKVIAEHIAQSGGDRRHRRRRRSGSRTSPTAA